MLLFSQISILHQFSMRLRKQARKRFCVSEVVLIFIQFVPYYIIINMLGQESTIFPKQIKLDDYADFTEGNIIRILQTSNILIGSGSRTSNAAVVLAKALHYLSDEGVFPLSNKNILQLGSGVGFLGIYLACLGNNVTIGDVPSIRDLAERNIGLNKNMIKGKIQFIVANWKHQICTSKCQEMSETQSSNSSGQRQECLKHLMENIDLTIVCECGGLGDLQYHLKWMGQNGMIVCFLERPLGMTEDFLTSRSLQEYLLEAQQYHPDYMDQRVFIYHIWK